MRQILTCTELFLLALILFTPVTVPSASLSGTQSPQLSLVFAGENLLALAVEPNPSSSDDTTSGATPSATGDDQPGTPPRATGEDQPGTPSSPVGVTGSVKLENPLVVDSIEKLLQLILRIILIFATPIIVFFIIYSGFLYVTAQGKPDQIQKATTAFTWTVIGGVLILGANVLLSIIVETVKSLQP